MILKVYNTTASPISYLSGTVTIAAGPGYTTVSQTYFFDLRYDGAFRAAINAGTIYLSDGTSDYGVNTDSLTYLDSLPGAKSGIGKAITSTTVLTREALDVFIASGSTTGNPDKSAFIEGATTVQPVAGAYKEAGYADLTDDTNAGARVTKQRAWHTNLRNNAGTEVGTAAAPLRTDTTGTTTQPVSAASLPLPSGAATSANQSTEITAIGALQVTQNSTTSGQSGTLVQGAVTTSAPSYTTGKTQPLSLTTSGGLRTDASGSTVTTQSGFVVSTANSSNAALGIGATFTGTWEDISAYEAITLSPYALPATAGATLTFQFSPDNGTTITVSAPLTITDPTFVIPIPLRAIAKYFRVIYVNGAVAQTTHRLACLLHYTASEDLSRFLNQGVNYNEPVKNVRAFLDVAPGPQDNIFAADKEIFGGAVTLQRISQIQAQYDLSIADNNVTTAVTASGTVTQANGAMTIASGTTTTASANAVSNTRIDYAPGREIYCMFTAAFTLPTSANTIERAGIYNATNGFFIQYNGTTFQIGSRNNTVDTYVSQSSWSLDSLTGAANSAFTRNGIPEAINFTLENVYRIRFGWLGAAPIIFEVMAPDGGWVNFHRIAQPNTSATPSITSPALPMTMEVVKTAANAQNVTLLTSSWDAGIVAEMTPQNSSIKRTYAAAAAGVTTALLATDVFTITGSANRKVRIYQIGISGVRSVAGAGTFLVLKRSTANTGGTSTTVASVSYDSADTAAGAVVRSYTANPTVGTLIGNIRAVAVFLPTAGLNSSSNEYVFDFESIEGKPVELNSASEVLAVNLGAATIVGASLNYWVTFSEE